MENLGYALEQLRHMLLLLQDPGSITQEGKKDSYETNNIWKCPCKIRQSLSAKIPLSYIGKAQLKGHSLL